GIPPPRFTDGLENASREYTREQVFQRIRHQSDVYGWEFVYLGAKLDAIAAGDAGGGWRGLTGRFARHRTFSGRDVRRANQHDVRKRLALLLHMAICLATIVLRPTCSVPMTEVALFEAKNRLSELIDRVQQGEVIAITRRGKVVAQLGLPGTHDSSGRAQDAVAELRAAREGVSLRGLKVRDLINEGRR
ncbi:MAG: type II toxin-antitoxin system prevent-host-death family antitoxin, partial [Rhodocyclaceae bacterium]|nr:type II toxin-antitoxin system prevent-host-death family antitoxin [Rhodocyclaceae bacterium]